MATPIHQKASIDDIRDRFDNDVDRFSNLDTGQRAVIDAPVMMELIAELAPRVVPSAENLLDIGCGAGNNTIKIVRQKPGLNCHLLDLSLPMLTAAQRRVSMEDVGDVQIHHGDFRDVPLPDNHYDIIVAAAVLHHLRDEADWRRGFARLHTILRPGGALFVSDMVVHAHPAVQTTMWERYGHYLDGLGGVDYRKSVFDYIDYEDSPRDLGFQIDLLRQVGFHTVDVVHKNSCFAAYVAQR